MVKEAKDRDRARARAGDDLDVTMDLDEEGNTDEAEGASSTPGDKIIVIHPGSQNLRIGLASDAIPRTVPMVIARKWKCSESEENGGEPAPKRTKLDDGSYAEPEKMFAPEACKSRELYAGSGANFGAVRDPVWPNVLRAQTPHAGEQAKSTSEFQGTRRQL